MRFENLTHFLRVPAVRADTLRRVAARVSSTLILTLIAANASAATFVVNSTTDAPDQTPGNGVCDTGALNSQANVECTLRAAIEEANALAGADTVNFNIPTSETGFNASPLSYTTQPASPYPAIAQTTTINGATQPDFPGTPIVVVDGAGAGAATDGFTFAAGSDNSTIRSLVVVNYSLNGIRVFSTGKHVRRQTTSVSARMVVRLQQTTRRQRHRLAACGSRPTTTRSAVPAQSIGTSSPATDFPAWCSGTAMATRYSATTSVWMRRVRRIAANTQEGIELEDSNGNTIGGSVPGAGNILSGNGSDGIEIDGSSNNIIQGNYIGTDVTGALVITNDRDGLDINDHNTIGATGNLIGGTAPGAGNIIRGGNLYGVSIRDALTTNNAVLGNSIYSNNDSDLDLNDDAPTPNDPGDTDTGSNDLQNYPEFVSLTETGGTITATVSLDTLAGDYRIEFFSNPAGAHPSGFGGGQVFESAFVVSHTGSGAEQFVHTWSGSAGDVVTATANPTIAGTGLRLDIGVLPGHDRHCRPPRLPHAGRSMRPPASPRTTFSARTTAPTSTA